MKDTIQMFHLTWNCIDIEITYDPAHTVCDDFSLASLEVRSVAPRRAPLPITETGYRSFHCNPVLVESYGGALAVVEAWLEDAAQAPKWRTDDMARRQLSLF